MTRLFLIVLAVWVGIVAAAPVARAERACGDEGLACGAEERCCEHVIATFSNDAPMSPPYIRGRCIAETQRCGDFWCGNRRCDAGFFGQPTVCCVNTPPGGMSAYACAHSELSCPGNSSQLSIRTRQPSRTLKGS